MEVILLESFSKLGKIGDVVNVKDGFARNFLIPQKKALRANKENIDHFANIKKDLLEKNNQVIEEAKKNLEIISKEEIVFVRNASDNGQLYGSVSPKDISNYFSEKKIEIKPSNINLHSAIKKIGIYNINIKLHAEVSCELKINVATSVENAVLQKNEADKVEKNEITKNDNKKNPEIQGLIEEKTTDIKKTVDTKLEQKVKKEDTSENKVLDDESKESKLKTTDTKVETGSKKENKSKKGSQNNKLAKK